MSSLSKLCPRSLMSPLNPGPPRVPLFFTPPQPPTQESPPYCEFFSCPPQPHAEACLRLLGTSRIFVSPAVEADLCILPREVTEYNRKARRYIKQYGLLYTPDTTMHAPLLPLQASAPTLVMRLIEDIQQCFGIRIHQMIIPRYPPNQGIFGHIHRPELGEIVISPSLASSTHTDVYWNGNQESSFSLPLSPCSLLTLCEEARYSWKHGIK